MGRATSCNLFEQNNGGIRNSYWNLSQTISGKEGSIVLNQPTRDKFFDPSKEFIPQKLDKEILIKARRSAPVYWIWENDQIKRVRFNPLKRKVKTLI